MKKNYYTITLLIINLIISTNYLVFAGGGDTYLSPKDTIYLTLGKYQKTILMHKMRPEQSIDDLTDFYGLTSTELFYFNPELRYHSFVPGQYVRIPIPHQAIIKDRKLLEEEKSFVPVYYIVNEGDNLFKIAHEHFNMSVDSIAQRNNLMNSHIRKGQTLLIGWLNTLGISSTVRLLQEKPIPLAVLSSKGTSYVRKLSHQKSKKKEKNITGIAFWQQNGENNNNRYALHRTAPINSIIEIKNPMTKKKAYAKVLGHIPDKAFADDVEVVISASVAHTLGVVESRFFVKIKYWE